MREQIINKLSQEKGFHQFKKDSDLQSFPDEFSSYVRNFGDVYFWPKGNFHVISRFQLAKEALLDPSLSCDRTPFFLSRMPHMDLSLLSDFFEMVSKMMVMSDGDIHQKRRTTATYGLNDKLLDNYAHRIKPLVEGLISKNNEASIDFATEVASHIPSVILADLFSIPTADRENFYRWSSLMTAFFGGGSGYENEDGIRVNEAARNLKDYFKKLLSERKSDSTNDFFAGMLSVSDRFSLDEGELISQAVMMLVAGQVTTSDQINNILYQLLKNPEVLLAVQKDISLVPAMIEEFTRLDPAVTFIFRVASQDTTIGNQKVNKGDTVFISSHCVNRDEEEFENPHQVNLFRRNLYTHFGYGFGGHFCLGARLARIEMKEIFTYLLSKYPKMCLSSKMSVRNHYSLSFSGFNHLWVELND